MFEVIVWNNENRSVYERSDGDEYLSKLSEEGFLFLTDRSEFWRNHKPIYVTQGERNKIIQSRKASRSSSLSILWDKRWCQKTKNLSLHIYVCDKELWINIAMSKVYNFLSKGISLAIYMGVSRKKTREEQNLIIIVYFEDEYRLQCHWDAIGSSIAIFLWSIIFVSNAIQVFLPHSCFFWFCPIFA